MILVLSAIMVIQLTGHATNAHLVVLNVHQPQHVLVVKIRHSYYLDKIVYVQEVNIFLH